MQQQTQGNLTEVEMGGSQNQVLSYKDIVMGQYKNIVHFFNREFRGGFYTTLPSKIGEDRLIYVEDTRETLSNSILGMSIILRPKFDNATEKYYQQILTRIRVLKKDFLKATTLNEKSVLGENFYEDTPDKILLHEYKNQKLDLFIKLFDKLCLLLHKLKYFQMFGGNF